MLALKALNHPPVLDAATLCRSDAPLAAHTIVLVDTTDALSALQMTQLRAAIADARDELPQYGKISVVFLSADNSFEPEEIVSLCNPGSSRGANPLYQNPEQIDRVWRRDFAEKIDHAVQRLANAPTAARSPILESVAAISWRPDFDKRVGERHLILVSDLLEYDPGDFSLYRKGDPWKRFRQSAVSARAQAELAGVTVRIELLRRPEWIALQSEELRAFWRQWLLEHGAVTVNFGSATEVTAGGHGTMR